MTAGIPTSCSSATNLNGTTHGAVLAVLAHGAQARFVARRGTGARPLSDTVDFLRPVPPDARLRVRTEEIRSGRRFWTVRSDLLLPDGRVAVRAIGTGGDRHRNVAPAVILACC